MPVVYSTVFPGTALPKHFAPHRLQLAPYAADTITFLNPGIRISLPTEFGDDGPPGNGGRWNGVVSAGWGFGGASPNCDIEIEWDNLILGTNVNTRRIGLALRTTRRLVFDSLNNTSNWVFVGQHRSNGGSENHWILAHFRPNGGGPNGLYTIVSSVAGASGITGKVRLVRSSVDTFEGLYWNGATWVSLGSFTHSDFQYDIMEVCLFTRRDANANGELTIDFKSFTLNSGIPIPHGSAATSPADDFADNIVPDPPKWSGPFKSFNLIGADIITEFGGALSFVYSAAAVLGNEVGFISNYVFYPGTNIDIVVDFEVLISVITQDYGIFFQLYNSYLDDVYNKLVTIGLFRTGTVDNRAFLQHRLNGPLITDANPVVDVAVPSRHTLRLTRVGSTWSAYLDGSGVAYGSFVDASGFILNSPLQISLHRFLQPFSGQASVKIHDLFVTQGDYQLPVTVTDSTIRIDRVFVVATNVLRIILTGPISTTPEYFQPSSYSITPLDGGHAIQILRVLSVLNRTSTDIFLVTSRPQLGKNYRITILDNILRDTNGLFIRATYDDAIIHKTKVDSTTSGLARFYNIDVGSTLRSIVQAIMISDEEIGGDF